MISQAITPYGGPLHRIAKAKGGRKIISLHPAHPALVEGHTIFPTTVVHPDVAPRLLVSGLNSRKIGGKVMKGRWAGMPIFTLTLEERATCPLSCLEWRTCYGNNMHFARRHIAGEALERRLRAELDALQAKHPRGFVVRLHVLGDFYSVDYVRLWAVALARLPALRIFGYTARPPETDIGAEVMRLTADDRVWIRFSGIDAGGLGALTIDAAADSAHVICPAQRKKPDGSDVTDCCATCALCWTMDRTVEFLRH